MSTFKPWPSSKLQLAKLQDFKGKMNKLATCTNFGKKNACTQIIFHFKIQQKQNPWMLLQFVCLNFEGNYTCMNKMTSYDYKVTNKTTLVASLSSAQQHITQCCVHCV